MERIIWLQPGQDVSYCPYCHSNNVWPCEVAGLWTCEDCQRDFIVRHRKPKPKPPVRAMSSDEFWTKMHEAGLVGNTYLKEV